MARVCARPRFMSSLRPSCDDIGSISIEVARPAGDLDGEQDVELPEGRALASLLRVLRRGTRRVGAGETQESGERIRPAD